MREYQPNSHRSKETANNETPREKRVGKVVSGNVKTKKNEGRRLANVFIAEDAGNIKSHLFMDVLVPAIKDAVYKLVTDGASMFLFGDVSSSNRKKPSGGRVSYRSYYNDNERTTTSNDSARSRFDYDDIVFATRGDAEAVLAGMSEAVETFGTVTVADMYDLADLSAPFTATRYGWVSMRNAEVIRVRDGFILKMPKPMAIGR